MEDGRKINVRIEADDPYGLIGKTTRAIIITLVRRVTMVDYFHPFFRMRLTTMQVKGRGGERKT